MNKKNGHSQPGLFLIPVLTQEFKTVMLVSSGSGQCEYPVERLYSTQSESLIYPEEIRRLISRWNIISAEKALEELSLERLREVLQEELRTEVYYKRTDGTGVLIAFGHTGFKDFDFYMTVKDVPALQEDVSEGNRLLAADGRMSLREEIFAYLSREIRVPLNAISGLTQVASSQFDSVRFPALKGYLDEMMTASEQLGEVVNDINEMRRIYDRKIIPLIQHTDLRELFYQLNAHIRKHMEEKEIVFSLRLNGLPPEKVMADDRIIRQMLAKLLKEAAERVPAGGSVELSAKELSRDGNLAQVIISVSDNGDPLTKEQCEAICRQESVEPENEEELVALIGIRMMIVKNYVAALGGGIKAAVLPEGGNEVTMVLPFPIATIEARKSAADPFYEQNALRKITDNARRVLIVDDNRISLEVCSKLLQNEGLDTLTASSGSEALELYRTNRGQFGLILMDIRMPGMNGLETSKKIRQSGLPNSRYVPIVALTANAFEEDIRSSLDAGMNEHLVKPIDSLQLKAMVARYMQNPTEQ